VQLPSEVGGGTFLPMSASSKQQPERRQREQPSTSTGSRNKGKMIFIMKKINISVFHMSRLLYAKAAQKQCVCL
ncbi:hypothetical protein ABG768_017693, partial [Culter alburnus]